MNPPTIHTPLTVATVLLVVACAGEGASPSSRYDAPVVDVDASRAFASSPEDDAVGCHLELAPACLAAELAETDHRVTSEITLRVTNLCHSSARLDVTANIFSSVQDDDVQVASLDLEAGETLEHHFDLETLGVTPPSLGSTGQVYLVAHPQFVDGTHATPTALTVAYTSSANGLVASAQKSRTPTQRLAVTDDDSGRIDEVTTVLADGPVRLTVSPFVASTSDDERSQARPVALPRIGDDPEDDIPFVNASFCFKQKTRYVDGGIGENTWTTNTTYARSAIGNYVEVTGPNAYSLNGYLSTSGCITPGTAIRKGNYTIKYRSRGRANGWDVEARNLAGQISRFDRSVYVDNDGTYSLTLPYAEHFNVYMAIAKALRSHGGPTSAKSTVEARIGDCSSTKYDGTKLYICDLSTDNPRAPNTIDRKFTIAHELGHLIQDASGGLYARTVHYDDHDPPNKNFCDVEYEDWDLENPNGDGEGAAHSTTSVEIVGVALNEGFANFYAADAFNTHSDPDDCDINIGRFGPHKCGGDVGDYYHPIKVMETNCTPGQGLGNETDWARTFWAIHTDPDADVSMNDILEWLSDAYADATPNSTLYPLTDAADANGFMSTWLRAAIAHGVNW